MWVAKRRFKKLKEERNAIKLQCMYRCYKARHIIKKLMEEKKDKIKKEAANLIGAAYLNWKIKKEINKN